MKGQKVADWSAVALRLGNARGAKGPYYIIGTLLKREVRRDDKAVNKLQDLR